MEAPFTVHRSPDAPILMIALSQHYSITEDIEASTAAIRSALDQAEAPLFYILDLSQLQANLDEVMIATSHSARGEAPLWHHPAIREIVFVSDRPLFKASALGLKSKVFGYLEHVKVFPTMGSAQHYCLTQLEPQGQH